MGVWVIHALLILSGMFTVFMGLMICVAACIRAYRVASSVIPGRKKFPSPPTGKQDVADSCHAPDPEGEESAHGETLEGPGLGARPLVAPAGGVGLVGAEVPYG